MRLVMYGLLAVLAGASSCQQPENRLPVYGNKTLATGSTDSSDYMLPSFQFLNQDSVLVSDSLLSGKIWIVDFFFTACPSICPKMKKEMLRVYEKYQNENRVVLLSFTIDPKRDSVARLNAYARKLGIMNSNKWHMLTGSKEDLYATAESFLVSAEEDPDAPGGHVHSGNFILVDSKRRLRGYYDGVKSESVDKLLLETDVLLNENAEVK